MDSDQRLIPSQDCSHWRLLCPGGHPKQMSAWLVAWPKNDKRNDPVWTEYNVVNFSKQPNFLLNKSFPFNNSSPDFGSVRLISICDLIGNFLSVHW